MNSESGLRSSELSAVLIAPNRELAHQFRQTLPETRAFQILADLKRYPSEQTLEIRLRQLRPEVVLLDLSADLETAEALIQLMAAYRPPVHIIGLHHSNDPEMVLRALRLGAGEFLCAPFDPAVQREAAAAILRLRQLDSQAQSEPGTLIAFSSAKPGSGASILACQLALALKKATNGRVLLADLDLTGGTVAFYLGLRHRYSFLDALDRSEQMDPSIWNSLVVQGRGVDVLPAPGVPNDVAVEPGRLRQVLEQAKRLYDWTILDLPAIFHRTSLLALAESDRAFLISTSELSSLHLARKAVSLLRQLGIGKDRLQVLVNRVDRGDGMSSSDMEKIFDCPVERCFPNDYASLHRVVTLGQPLEGDCALGKAVDEFARGLGGTARSERRGTGFLLDACPALAGT
jgi:pilus assembly protein CpaE